MNRTDRLYALVDELRAIAPRARTARQMAARFEVSVRTIERDLGALQQAGVPICATPGSGGGYAVDRDHMLPPVNFSSEEATALAIALSRPRASPLADALRSACARSSPPCRRPRPKRPSDWQAECIWYPMSATVRCRRAA